MADIRIKKRKRMREKEIKQLSMDLKQLFTKDFSMEKDVVDIAESTDFNVIFVNGDILCLIYEGKPFLTIKGLLAYKPETKSVTVDMGAVPYVTNGADVMGPGIVDVDSSVKEGDLVWVKDVKNGVPLAVGVALYDAIRIKSKEKGRAIKVIHNVGDKLWKYGE